MNDKSMNSGKPGDVGNLHPPCVGTESVNGVPREIGWGQDFDPERTSSPPPFGNSATAKNPPVRGVY